MGVTGIRRLLVVVVLGASVGLNMFTSAIVNLALPTLAADLNADIATVQWVILAYFVTIASLHLPMGRLGDRFGRRRIFLIGATIFALGALLSGFASGLWPLVAMRVVQGFGGGIMQAIGPPLLVSSFPDSERGRATGIIGLMIAVGLLAGPAAGGLLIGAFGWPSIFFANVPVAGFVLIAGALVLREPAGSRDRSYDLTGAFLAAGWIAPLVFFLNRGFSHGWSSAPALAAVGLSGAVLLIFITHQRRRPSPLLNLAVFLNRGFRSAVLISYLGYGAYTSVMLLGPFLLQNGLGFPVARVGLLLAVVPAVGALVSIPAGELTDRFGHSWPRSAGLLFIAAGSISLAGAGINSGTLDIVLRLAVVGVGQGFLVGPNTSAMLGALRSNVGIAGGFLASSRTLALATGQAVWGGLFVLVVTTGAEVTSALDADPEALLRGFQVVFLAAAVVAIAAAVIATRDRQVPGT